MAKPEKGLYIPYPATGVWYMRFQQNGVRVHESTETTKVGEANQVILARRMEIISAQQDDILGSLMTQDDMTFKKASSLAFTEVFSHQRGSYEASKKIGVLNELIGEKMVSEINPTTYAYIARKLRLRPCGNNTINKYFATINRTLEIVQKHYNAPCHPFPKVYLKVARGKIRDISRSEEKLILEWLEKSAFKRQPRGGWTNQDLVEIYKIGTMTGMRRGEIFSFRVEQVRGQILILEPSQHKTGDNAGDKTIVLSKDAVALIKKRIKRYNLKPQSKVFGYSKVAFTKLWNRMKKDIGLAEDRRFTPHCMRHTFASRMAEKHVPLYHVSKMLGHSTVKTTEMYAHLFADELIKTINQLPAD